MRTIHLAGFAVITSPAWLAGAALLVVSLVASLPLGIGPRIDGALSIVVAAIAAAILVVVIVGLWLERAMTARSRGATVTEVRVLALGLPPAQEARPASAASELRIGLVAPVTGGLLGAALVATSRVVVGDGTDIVTAIHWGLTWLGFGVLVVAAFISLPLLPLDGGRVVRAVAWRLTGDLDRAGRATTAIGRGFGYAVLGAGLLVTFAGELLVGIWLLFLGWLATRVARAASERARLEELTAGLLVSDAVDRDPPTIGPALTVDALMARAEQDGGGVYPVIEDGHLAGVVFTARIPRRTRRRWTVQHASDVMVPRARLRSLREGDPLLEAVVRLEGGRVAAFPVVADDDPTRLVGLVKRDDVLERLRARQAIADARVGPAGKATRG